MKQKKAEVAPKWYTEAIALADIAMWKTEGSAEACYLRNRLRRLVLARQIKTWRVAVGGTYVNYVEWKAIDSRWDHTR